MRIRNGKEVTREWLNYMEIEEGKGEQEIADELGISRMGLYKIRKKMGWDQIRRSDKGVSRVDPEDKREKRKSYMREYAMNHPEKFSYVMKRNGKRVVSEHRLVANETFHRVFGRELRSDECVHHINGNPRDNRKINLLVCSYAYHSELHKRMRGE